MSNFNLPPFDTQPFNTPNPSNSRPQQSFNPLPTTPTIPTTPTTPPPTTSTSTTTLTSTTTTPPTTTTQSLPPSPTPTLTTSTSPNNLPTLAPLPTPISSPLPNSPPQTTTILRTVTRDDGQPSIIVVTQTLAPNPTPTNAPTPNNPKNEQSGSVLPIVIPCVIVGLVSLVGLGLLIRWLKNRSAAARAAEDIKWPEVINSDGDRAALYPEPTRPGMGHGLGDEDEDGLSTSQMGQVQNFAGAGAGNRNTLPSNLSRNNTGSATTYLNSSSNQDHNTNNPQHFYTPTSFPGPPAPQVSAPHAAYPGYYHSSSPPKAYPHHPNTLLSGVTPGGLHGPREMQQQAYGAPDYYNNPPHQDYAHHQQDKDYNAAQDYGHHQQDKDYNAAQDYAHHQDQDYQHDNYDHQHQAKEYDDPLAVNETGSITHPIHHQYQSTYPPYQEPHPSRSPPQQQHSPPDANHPESPISLSDENFYRDPSSRISDHHLHDDHSPDHNAGGGRRLVALNPDEDP